MSVIKLSLILAAAAWQDAPDVDHRLPTLEEPPVRERGLASWYGDGSLHGRRTASGELIDVNRHTCAHRTLPLQTTVLLVNGRDSSKRAWCRINDRGPYGAVTSDGSYVVKTRPEQDGKWRGVLDISIAVARELGTHEQGLEPVEIHYWPRDVRASGSFAAVRRPAE